MRLFGPEETPPVLSYQTIGPILLSVPLAPLWRQVAPSRLVSCTLIRNISQYQHSTKLLRGKTWKIYGQYGSCRMYLR